MNQGEGPRLGFQVDTSGLERATTAAAQAASKIQPLGDVADRAAQRLTATGRAAQQAATATGNAAQQIENIARATELATAKFGLLSGAVGGLVSMLGFQLVGAANAAANAIARLPGEAARAVDQINMLQSKLNFAFRGNTAVAGQARADILAIAQRNGIPLQQAMQAYGEIGVSARGTGISQSAVTGVTQAFNNLAQISGAGPSQTNAAIYQFQQALSKGSLQYQDFRYILNSLPAFDYALGKGLGRTPGELMQMVGSGQIDAQKLVKGFTDGVAIIEKESGGIPETVERSQNRLRNSWELMLVSMGETLKTGPLLRAWNDFQQKIIDGMRVSMSPESDPQGAIVQLLAQARNQNAGRPYRRGQDFLTAPQREKLNYLLSLLNARETERRVGQNFDESDSLMERNQQVAADARQSNAISTQRSQIEEQIKKYSETLATGVGLNGRSYDEIRAARDTLRAQLKRTLSPFDIYQLDSGSRLGNRAAYGSDAAGIADRAYEMAISERGALGASDEDTIRAYLFNEDRRGKLISFAEQRRLAAAQGRLRRGAIGGGYDAGVSAQVSADVLAFRSANRGRPDLDSLAGAYGGLQSALAGERTATELAQQKEADRIALDRAQREREAARDPAAQRKLELELRLEQMRRETTGPGQADREASIRAQAAAQDRAAVEATLAATQRQLDADAKKLEIQTRVAREYQIQARIVERIAQAEADGRILTKGDKDEIARQEQQRDKDEEAKRKLTREIQRFESIGVSTANAVGAAFDTALQDAFAKGRLSLQNLGKVAQSLALDITSTILKKTLADPLGDAASTGIKSLFKSIFRGSAHGDMFEAGALRFAAGGVVSSPTRFAYGGGIGLMGEAGSEAILPLKRGPDGRLGVGASGGGGGDVQVVVNDMRSGQAAPVDVQQSRGADGKRMIQIAVRDAVRQGFASGDYDQPMNTRFGAARAIKRV